MILKPVRTFIAILLVLFMASIFSCATASIRSQTDPQFIGHQYIKLAVYVNFADIGLRQDTERQIQRHLQAGQTQAIASIDLFFPSRTYSAEEAEMILSKANVDGFLVIANADAGTTSTWVPQITRTTGSATLVGNTVYGQTTTRNYGGYNATKPWADFQAFIIDRSSKATTWIAQVSTRGNAFANWSTLAQSMASSTASQLFKDSVVKKFK